MSPLILAIDQGTTSTRAIVFDAALTPVATAQQEFAQIYPAPGLVEHDPEEIWSTTVATVRAAHGEGRRQRQGRRRDRHHQPARDHDRLGPRDRPPIHNAIVWQDRRTADACAALRQAGHEPAIAERTGLLLDPYFSATKIAWLLDHVEGAREAAAGGPARLRHRRQLSALAADRRQGARDRRHQCRAHAAVRHPRRTAGTRTVRAVRRARRAAAGGARLRRRFRHDSPDLFGGPIRILGIAGDQQAATVGQGCFTPGMMKVDLRHRLLRAAQHRRRAGRVEATACSPPSPISSAASAPMRSKARFSSPAPPCNGCATRSR